MDNVEIARRLDRYDKALNKAKHSTDCAQSTDSTNPANPVTDTAIDSMMYLANFIDLLCCRSTDLCICPVDEESYYVVDSIETREDSDCAYAIDFTLVGTDSDTTETISLPRYKNIEIFTLNKEDDTEEEVAMIEKTVVKSGKRKVVSEIDILITSSKMPHKLKMVVDAEHFTLRGNHLSFKLNYMDYSHVD